LWALVAAFSYAASNVFTGAAVEGEALNYQLGVSLQALPTFLFSLFMVRSARRREPELVSPFSDWKLWAALVGNGLLIFVLSNPLFFQALDLGGILVASPVAGTSVLWGALFATLLLSEPFNRAMAGGMGISVLGVFLLSWGRSGDLSLTEGWWWAIPLATGTAIGWALSGVLITYAMRRGVERFQALAVATLVGITANQLYLLLTGRFGLYLTTPPRILLNVLIAGLFNATALISLTSAFSLTSVISASTISSLQLGLAPLFAWLFVGERINVWMMLGVALIMGGVMLVQRARAAISKQEELGEL
jgi:drug/metabolite transporter (DMT)-like permease